MAPNERQKIEIEKTHRDPLLSFNQAVTVDWSDFLGTALKNNLTSELMKATMIRQVRLSQLLVDALIGNWPLPTKFARCHLSPSKIVDFGLGFKAKEKLVSRP